MSTKAPATKTAEPVKPAPDLVKIIPGAEVELYERKGAKPVAGTIEQISPDGSICVVKIKRDGGGAGYLENGYVYSVAIAEKAPEAGSYVLGLRD